ncbi:CsMn29 [Gelatoporia subvermispora B]|uniref:CsMn29 n=1 Tax=Ceriporiopsis subvermispora (strain B) TaxID=914234 RepID=M2R6B9_CERS8|nr:CsMn29 [Gelatoporia subvermispora B]
MPYGNSGADGIDDDADPTLVWRSELPAERSTSSFTSAVKPHQTRPAVRRRGSEGTTRRSRTDHDPWQDDDTHARARTRTAEAGTSTNHHPLVRRKDSATTHTRTPFSAHDTRPHLKRLLSDLTPAHGDSAVSLDPPDDRSRVPPAKEEEKVVLVHEVLPTDSLAGVALKYGIRLADLRKANQLWASDSIHLRKVLYIPLELARPTKQFSPDILAAAVSGDMPAPGTGRSDDTAGSNDQHTPSASGDRFTIVRVPASQLSFFLRSSRSPSSLHSSASRHHTLPRSIGSPYGPPLDFTSSASSAATSTSALSSSLPPASAPPSTPSYVSHIRSRTLPFSSASSSPAGRLVSSVSEALIARLSLDSTSGQASSSSDEQDWAHEMVDVSAASSSDQTDTTLVAHGRLASPAFACGDDYWAVAGSLGSIPLTPRRSNSLRSPRASPSRTPARSQNVSTKQTGYSRPLSASQSQGSVRTMQMEPSPVMQLPLVARKSKPREGGEEGSLPGLSGAT